MKTGLLTNNLFFPEMTTRNEAFAGRRRRLPGPVICFSNGGAAAPTLFPVSRKEIETRREGLLHPFACRSECNDPNDRRLNPEGPDRDPSRTRFARDRDRVIHSNAFMFLPGRPRFFQSSLVSGHCI